MLTGGSDLVVAPSVGHQAHDLMLARDHRTISTREAEADLDHR
jgi:hypothetical protein